MNNLMFIDDIKIFGKNEKKIETRLEGWSFKSKICLAYYEKKKKKWKE